MQESGQRAHSAATGAFLALGALCALVPSLAMWGFTVDDALIPVRYAHNLATGAGYRFDAHGVSTDGVTPLPWAFVLAPFSRGGALASLAAAKVLGVAAWTLAGAALGARVGRMIRGPLHGALCAAALVMMGLAFPIGAWAASGLETGVATALATLACARLGRGRGWSSAALAGATAALRPEMVVWAIVIGSGAASDRNHPRARGGMHGGPLGALVAAAPFVLCALVRVVVFGRPAPLAVLAKPSDLSHGALYAVAATVVVLTPLLVLAPVTLARGDGGELRTARILVAAFVAHVLAVTAAGGDWMPYARLVVPAAPSLVIAFAVVAATSRAALNGARLGAAAVLGTLLVIRAAPAGRHVQHDRADLVARARPVLADARVVAALDIGWVSASTDARIVDLAGLTDPAIALLPGGHTSKRVDTAMLLDRDVDTVVVYSELRVVEARIVRSELFASRFEPATRLALGDRGASYTVYRRRPAP